MALTCLSHFRNVFKLGDRLCNSLIKMSSDLNNLPRVFVTRSDYPKSGIDILKARCAVEEWDHEAAALDLKTLIEKVKDLDALCVKPGDIVNRDVISQGAKKLKVISTLSVGVDHIDLKAIKEFGIRLGHTPDVLTEGTAELIMALLLATSRRLFEANNELKTGGWTSWGPLWMCGQGLEGSVVGIVGYGRIGQSVARKLIPFKVSKILYASKGEKLQGKELGAENTTLDDLLKRSDFVICTTTLTLETRHMFNKDKFNKMKPTSIFINASRGDVVKQDDLVEALKTCKIHAAGLDVMTPEPLPLDHPLQSMPNCVLLPHIGSATYQARMAMSELLACNVLAALDGKSMPAEYPLE